MSHSSPLTKTELQKKIIQQRAEMNKMKEEWHYEESWLKKQIFELKNQLRQQRDETAMEEAIHESQNNQCREKQCSHS